MLFLLSLILLLPTNFISSGFSSSFHCLAFATTAAATAAATEAITPEWLPVISNGGIGIIIFVIWYFTFRGMMGQQQGLMQSLLDLVKQDAEYKSLLSGILTRVESKVDSINQKFDTQNQITILKDANKILSNSSSRGEVKR